MTHLKPRTTGTNSLQVLVSDKTMETLKQFEKYSGYTTDEIVDFYISQISEEHEEFQKYLKTQRYSKKIEKKIFQNGN